MGFVVLIYPTQEQITFFRSRKNKKQVFSLQNTAELQYDDTKNNRVLRQKK